MLIVFDFMDDFSKMREFGRHYWPSERMQIEAIQSSDLIVAVTKVLLEKARQHGKPAVLIPNGVRFEDFVGPYEPHPMLRAFSPPVIGFLGTFGSWIDIDLLCAVAEEFPDALIVFVGNVLSDVKRLQQFSNVHFVKSVPYPEVPAVLVAFDVCLNPFDMKQPVSSGVSPLKLYEYLAAGKLVVSTWMHDLERVADVVYVAHNK